MIQVDIKCTDDGDVDLGSGDLQLVESTGQHKRDILLADKGDYKEFPATGVGAINFLHDTQPDTFLRKVRQECARDGMKVRDVRNVSGELLIDAEYADSNR